MEQPDLAIDKFTNMLMYLNAHGFEFTGVSDSTRMNDFSVAKFERNDLVVFEDGQPDDSSEIIVTIEFDNRADTKYVEDNYSIKKAYKFVNKIFNDDDDRGFGIKKKLKKRKTMKKRH